jgi:hypothetical protein
MEKDPFNIHDAIVLTLKANDGEITSKTTMQKLLYFYTMKSKTLNTVQHIRSFYGPFSRQVAFALDDLREFSFMDEKVTSGYYEIYHYKLTKDGEDYAERISKEHPEEYEIILNVVKTCKKYCDLEPLPLSYAAKSHYIITHSKNGSQKECTIANVTEVAKNFNWKISQEDVDNGLALLKTLGYISE